MWCCRGVVLRNALKNNEADINKDSIDFETMGAHLEDKKLGDVAAADFSLRNEILTRAMGARSLEYASFLVLVFCLGYTLL